MQNDPRYKHVHTALVPIRWGDMDAMGHVNNTVYFRYMEQARMEWIDGLGCTADGSEAPVIVNASCTFLIPLTYPGMVEIQILVGNAGRSSLPTHYVMRPHGDERIFAQGAAKVVWTSTRTGKSIPLPEKLRAIAQNL